MIKNMNLILFLFKFWQKNIENRKKTVKITCFLN
jgi:hypothetical protein